VTIDNGGGIQRTPQVTAQDAIPGDALQVKSPGIRFPFPVVRQGGIAMPLDSAFPIPVGFSVSNKAEAGNLLVFHKELALSLY
jgi:hypothetical protein